MIIFRQIIVRKNERGLLFKKSDFIKILEPGTYHFFDPFHHITVEFYDLSTPAFSHPLSDFLLKEYPEMMARYFTVVELNAQQVALIYKNGLLADILLPATRHFYWQGVIDITTEIIDISEQFEISQEQAALLVYSKNPELISQVKETIYSCEIPEHKLGLLMVNGQYVKTLSPGLHAYWIFNRHITVTVWETRLQEMEVAGQEILTKDKVSLRINLSAGYQYQNILRMTGLLENPKQYLYKELQFGLRAAVGTRSLDELLENKDVINEAVLNYITEKTKDIGMTVQNVGVKDIILPGEMKTILNKVVEAEKVAQANLIKRREETAATRSLLNTAKVMEDNPTALRLKEMELLEKITENVNNLSVFGGLEGLLKGIIKIN
jgi:regulator of protease activity HflC (stomatin/prohibitin superfamily)